MKLNIGLCKQCEGTGKDDILIVCPYCGGAGTELERLPFCTRCFGVGISYGENGTVNFCHQCGSEGTCVPVGRDYINYLQENIDRVRKVPEYTKEQCKQDTLAHINQVRELMMAMVMDLTHRAWVHDQSKLEEPEISIFTEYTPKLKNSTYGSPEYAGFLKGMGEALKHHYANNSHHPEHHDYGVRGMTLMDVVEMLCDWKAASTRHADGDIYKSIAHNQGRFGLSDDLVDIFKNTADAFGW